MRLACAVLALVFVPVALSASQDWEPRAPMPLPRTEVSAAAVGNEIVVLGGFTIDRGASNRVDAYSPTRNSWRRLPDLPVGVHHSTAVGAGGKVYVLGGYTVDGLVLRSVFVLDRGRWRSLPRMPFPRAAAGAGVAGGKIVVAGGVTIGASRLARNALSFDLRTRRWSIVPGPTPREHLAVTSLGGTVYAVAGRTSGLDTNLMHFESYRPGDRSWRRLAPVPDARGGTGAAALNGHVVSVGGEEPDGTIAEVLAYRISDRRWVQLDDLATPRHGVGVAALGGRVYVIGGGPEPGLTVSSANEALRVDRASRSVSAAGSASAGGLTFTRADGSRIAFRGRARAWCGAWNDLVPKRTVHIALLGRNGRVSPEGFWHVFVVAADVARARVLTFPAGVYNLKARGAIVFAYDSRTKNEASTEQEDGRGRITFAPVRCELGHPVRFTISAILGSEFSTGKPIRVTGAYEGRIGARPPGWPR